MDDHNIKEIITKKYPNSAMNNTLIGNSLVTDYQQQEKSFNMMLIEDESDTLLTYKAFLLSAEGYNVDTFLNSNEALKQFVNLNHPYYDLVITDIRMPGLNGLQLYQKIKNIDDSIKVIFVSALDSVEEMVSIFPDLHLNNFIRKPVTQNQFLDKVKGSDLNIRIKSSNTFSQNQRSIFYRVWSGSNCSRKFHGSIGSKSIP